MILLVQNGGQVAELRLHTGSPCDLDGCLGRPLFTILRMDGVQLQRVAFCLDHASRVARQLDPPLLPCLSCANRALILGREIELAACPHHPDDRRTLP